MNLGEHFSTTAAVEVLEPKDMPPPQHLDYLGFEDPRPFLWRGDLWCICCVCQLNPEGYSQIVLARIDRNNRNCVFTNWRVLTSGMPLRWEKNWVPQVIGDELRFIYSIDPTRIISEAGVVVHQEAADIAAENFKGGSQAIPFDGGWLMVVHEWEWVNGKRDYLHRLVWLDNNNRLIRLSRRFYFKRISGEFASGLAWHVRGKRLVISFAVDEQEPYLAVVDASDIRAALLDIDEHRRASKKAAEAGRSTWEALTRRPSAWVAEQTNSALRSGHAVEYARAATLAAGLPRHPDLPKVWDNFLALFHTLATTEPDSPVLDAGAGRESAYLPGLRTLGYSDLTGINLLEGEAETVDGVCYRYGDITNTEFAEAHFGFVTCLSVIEHGVDWRLFLREMARILRPGGHLFVSMDYWRDPIDVGDRISFGVPVKIFTLTEVMDLAAYASELGLVRVGDLELSCEQKVIACMGLDYTFCNLFFRRSSRLRQPKPARGIFHRGTDCARI